MKNLLVPYKSQWDSDGGKTNNDCGPASLAMLLNYYGENLTTNDVFQQTGAGLGLITWTELQKAITHFGYVSHLERSQDLAKLRKLIDEDKPVVILVRYGSLKSTQDKKFKKGHFFLVVGYNNDGFFVNDPNFKEPLRQDGDHHDYLNDELNQAWKDCTLDGNQPFSLLWIERKTVPVPPPINDDAARAMLSLERFRVEFQHGNLEGAMNALIGAYKDLQTVKPDLENLKAELRDRESYIQGQKATIEELKSHQSKLAQLLGVENDFAVILGECEKLVKVEDNYDVALKKIEVLEAKLNKIPPKSFWEWIGWR